MERTYELLYALVSALGKRQICAYLVNMAVRLVEMHRVLKPTGSIYLHCDPTASHYLKILMDSIFGVANFRNEIVWRIGWVSGFKTQKRGWIRNHDTILYYLKTSKAKKLFNKEYIPYPPDYVRRDGKRPTGKGFPIEDTWNCSDQDRLDSIMIKSFSTEKLSYPTQKPVDLLKRIIKASSNKGDVVLDPFCGCGTTIAAAEQLQRNWIGIDITYSAVAAIKERFKREKLTYWSEVEWDEIEILNSPKTVREVDDTLLNEASPLYARKEFEKFCVSVIGGLPNDKMGADGGIDGKIPLDEDKVAICSVKSGSVGVSYLYQLKGLLDEKNVAGVFLSREKPTRPMVKFAKEAGIHKMAGLYSQKPFPKLQILTLEQILKGKRPDLPYKYAA